MSLSTCRGRQLRNFLSSSSELTEKWKIMAFQDSWLLMCLFAWIWWIGKKTCQSSLMRVVTARYRARNLIQCRWKSTWQSWRKNSSIRRARTILRLSFSWSTNSSSSSMKKKLTEQSCHLLRFFREADTSRNSHFWLISSAFHRGSIDLQPYKSGLQLRSRRGFQTLNACTPRDTTFKKKLLIQPAARICSRIGQIWDLYEKLVLSRRSLADRHFTHTNGGNLSILINDRATQKNKVCTICMKCTSHQRPL